MSTVDRLDLRTPRRTRLLRVRRPRGAALEVDLVVGDDAAVVEIGEVALTTHSIEILDVELDSVIEALQRARATIGGSP